MSAESSPPGSVADIATLQQEVARLQAELAEAKRTSSGPVAVSAAGGDRPNGHRLLRTIVSAVLIVVACLLAPLSAVAVWARGEITDTDRYVQTVAPLASDPAVQAAVTTRVTNEIFEYIDVNDLTTQAVTTVTENRQLTPQQSAALTALSGALVNGVQNFTNDQVDKVVASPQFASAWMEANTVAHQQLTALLSGQGDSALGLEGDAVTLDVGEVVAQVKTELIDQGFSVAEKIPAVNTTVTVFQSSNIGTIQAAYNALNALGIWLPVIAAGLAILGVIVANERRTAVLGIGIGLLVASFAAGVALAVGRQAYLAALPSEVNAAAATVFFDTIIMFLKQTLWAGAAAGAVLALGAILTGGSQVARGVRRSSCRVAGSVQGVLASWGANLTAVRTWVAAQATGLRVAVTIVAVAVVLLQRYKTPELIGWTTLGLLVALFVIQVLASGDEPEADPATT